MKKLTSREDCAKIYTAILTRMGTEIYNTAQIYSLVKEIKDETEGEYSLFKNPTELIKRLTKLVGKDNYEKVEDESVKLRGKNAGNGYLINFKNIEEGLKRIRRHYKIEDLTKKDGSISTDSVDEETTIRESRREEKKSIKKISSAKLSMVQRLWKLYVDCVSRKKSRYTLEEIAKIWGISYPLSKSQLDLMENSAKKLGITMMFYYTAKEGRKNSYHIELNMPENTILSISEIMKEYGHGDEFIPGPYLKLGKRSTEDESESTTEIVERSEEEKKLMVELVSLCRKEIIKCKNHPVQPIMLKFLVNRDQRFKETTEEEIIEALKETELFNFITDPMGSLRVQLKDYSEVEEETKSSPKEQIETRVEEKTTLARLSMSLRQVHMDFPKAVIVSEIEPDDNIFEIPYEDSKINRSKLSRLYLKMRGTEKFLDRKFQEFIATLTKEIYWNYENE